MCLGRTYSIHQRVETVYKDLIETSAKQISWKTERKLDNIKMDFKTVRCGVVDWIHPPQDRVSAIARRC